MTDTTRDGAIINGLNATPSNVCMDDDERAAYFLRALADAGYVVVPREPSDEMMRAFYQSCDEHGQCLGKTAYRAMIQAGG